MRSLVFNTSKLRIILLELCNKPSVILLCTTSINFNRNRCYPYHGILKFNMFLFKYFTKSSTILKEHGLECSWCPKTPLAWAAFYPFRWNSFINSHCCFLVSSTCWNIRRNNIIDWRNNNFTLLITGFP